MRRRMQNMLLGLSLLCFFAMPSFATEKPVQEYDTIDEYIQEATELLDDHPCSFQKDEEKYPYQSKRIIVDVPNLPDTFGAIEAVGYNDSYILQYATEKETAEAYRQLIKIYGEFAVSLDQKAVLVEDAEGTANLQALVDPPIDHENWGISYMGLDVFQSYLQKAKSNLPQVKVAVVDSGVCSTNPYLKGRLDMEHAKNVSGSEEDDVTDSYGHGTHVAGIVAEGTSDNVKVLPVKAFQGASTSVSYVRLGFEYALAQEVQVINLSLAIEDFSQTSTTLHKCIEEAKEKGVIVCVAAGNSDDEAEYYYPGNHPDVLCIGTMNKEEHRGGISNYGSVVDYVAPGDSIHSTSGMGFSYKSGTSMASPHVAAAAALLKSWDPSMSKSQICNVFDGYAVHLENYRSADSDPFALFDETDYKVINLQSFGKDHCTHTYEDVVVPATFIEDGCVEYKCQKCDDVQSSTKIARISKIEIEKQEYHYNGKVMTPALSLENAEGLSLIKNKDYTIKYRTDCQTVGSHTLEVIMQGNYTGTKTLHFEILDCLHQYVKKTIPASFTEDGSVQEICSVCNKHKGDKAIAKVSEVLLSDSASTYTGKMVKPSVLVKDSKKRVLEAGVDYILEYPSECINPGKYSLKVMLKGNYSGSKKIAFTIVGAKPSSIRLNKTSFEYDGTNFSPLPVVKGLGNVLKKNVDYTVTYAASRKAVGIYAVTIKMMGNYRGTYIRKYKVIPKGTTITKIDSRARFIHLRWKKQTKQTTGYEIRLATDAKFKKLRKFIIKNNKINTTKISGLTRGKKYYISIRSYKTVNGKTFYSTWQKTKVFRSK